MENMFFHVIGCHARCFRGRQWLPQLRRYVLRSIVHFILVKNHLAVLCNTSTTHNFVNQYSKPWFCEILRDTFRDGCQCLRTRVDYLIFLITLQVCKFLEGRCVEKMCYQVSWTKGENGSCIYLLNLNHLVFQRPRLIEGLRARVKLIHK